MADVCHGRISYNKTETRFGNGEAKIVDYALQYEGLWDVVDVPFPIHAQHLCEGGIL